MRWVGGVVTSLVRKYTKRGELMATFVLEDLQSAVEVWVFPRTMTDVGHLLADDAVVCVKGRLDLRDDTAQAHLHGAQAPRSDPSATTTAAPRCCPFTPSPTSGSTQLESPAGGPSGGLAGVPPRGLQVHPAERPSSTWTPPTDCWRSSVCCSARAVFGTEAPRTA